MAIEIVLKKLDFVFWRAYDGLEAFEILKTKLDGHNCKHCCFFKAVIMDLNMPVMDGAKTTAKMIELLIELGKDIKKMPIIGLSAYDDKEHTEYSLGLGMAAFTGKPIKKEVMMRVLHELDVLKN
jgi:CheY-like chemotaxis protein